MKTKRILAALVLITFILTTYGVNMVYAAPIDVSTPAAPNNLAIPPTDPTKEPPIGFNSGDGGESGYYADIQWNAIANPSNKYVNIYMEKSPKGYQTAEPVRLQEKDLPAGTSPIRMRNLSSGTVYKANARTYATETDPITGTVYRSSESINSNTVKFMTDINIQCLTMSTSQIKIVWDDVWNDGKRISYRLYVSENKDFANTLPITITQDQIGASGPVIVNQADGTLEYVHTVRDPGRVYYVKIEPIVSDVIKTSQTKTVPVSTYILVKTSKVSSSDLGTIWRLDWSPVVTGLSATNITVKYQINKYTPGSPMPEIAMEESGTTTFITVGDNEVNSYFIRAVVKKDGMDYYPEGIDLVSDTIVLKESEVPSTPSTPELVPQFVDSADKIIIAYEDVKVNGNIVKKGELGTDTATILWNLPRKADGTVDKDVMYDIWLIEDLDQIDKPPVETRIQESFKPGDDNYVIDETNNRKLTGYKYKLEGLSPNHSYYLKIVAKKMFAEERDGIIQNVEHSSNPALKVITTLSTGDMGTPLIPSNPPLQIRKQEDGIKDLITDTSVTIQLKNRWYESFDPATGRWSYIQADKTSLNDNPPYNPAEIPPDNINYRKVKYDPGVTLYVGCTEYTEGIDISSINTYALEKVPTTPNDGAEDSTLNVPENVPVPNGGTAIYAKHNVLVPVNDLEPNTTYILWVRAAREEDDTTLFSDVSNPIIFTTLPTPVETIEKPVVPNLRCTNIADTFVDLAWDYKEQNTYYIKYGTEDDITKAKGSLTVTGGQIRSSGLDYVRIPDLTANTQYYFWIQAEAFNSDMTTSESSEWSDSLPLRTLQEIPPSTPRGFGVKNTADAVTKNSVTFEWIREPGLEYILEIAGNVDYSDKKVYEAGSNSEIKVGGLTSNFRYYARLYAYDPVKKLRSLPTPSISVKTLRSSDDYDSDQDVEHPISDEIVKKDPTAVNGVWNVKIVGVDADRLVQIMMTDNVLDYTVDISNPPATSTSIALMISKKVFDKLDQLKENISFKTAVVSYNMKAGILSNITAPETGKEQIYIFNIELTPQKPTAHENELILRQPLAQMEVSLDNARDIMTISQFALPLIISYPYTNPKDYEEGLTVGARYNEVLSSWEQTAATNRFDVDNSIGTISFQSAVPGLFALADRTDNLFDDIYGHAYESSITNVAMAHKLKSVTGRMFNPDKSITVGEAVKLTLDTLEYGYGSDYMDLAAKIGLIKSGRSVTGALTRQEAANMATVLYEIITKTRVKGSSDVISTYKDYGKIDKTILSKVAFATENGFVPNASSSMFNPTQSVTRGELMYIVEKALVLAGDM